MRGISLPLTLIVNGATYMFQNVWSYVNTVLMKKYYNTDSKLLYAFINTIVIVTPILWFLLTNVFLNYMHYTPLQQAEMEQAGKKIDTEISKMAVLPEVKPEVKSETVPRHSYKQALDVGQEPMCGLNDENMCSLGNHILVRDGEPISYISDYQLLINKIEQINPGIALELTSMGISDQSIKNTNEIIKRAINVDEYVSTRAMLKGLIKDPQHPELPTLTELFNKYAGDPRKFANYVYRLIEAMEVYGSQRFLDRVIQRENK